MEASPVQIPKRSSNTVVSAYLILRRDQEILLLLRKNTGYCDGLYGLVAGHVEDGESATAGMVREAYEEAGIIITAEQLKVVLVIHRKTNRFGIDIFFECSTPYDGPLENREPEKCAALEFFPLNLLPSNTIPYLVRVLKAVSQGQFYSEEGWDS
jgi:8-oxo-dGTP pyrophosphatase MutT (NUDIX family)